MQKVKVCHNKSSKVKNCETCNAIIAYN
jgi:hypothetical protein